MENAAVGIGWLMVSSPWKSQSLSSSCCDLPTAKRLLNCDWKLVPTQAEAAPGKENWSSQTTLSDRIGSHFWWDLKTSQNGVFLTNHIGNILGNRLWESNMAMKIAPFTSMLSQWNVHIFGGDFPAQPQIMVEKWHFVKALPRSSKLLHCGTTQIHNGHRGVNLGTSRWLNQRQPILVRSVKICPAYIYITIYHIV